MMVFSFFLCFLPFLFFVHDSLPAKPQGVRSSTSRCDTGRAFTTAAYNSAAPVAVLEVTEYHHHPTAPEEGKMEWENQESRRSVSGLLVSCSEIFLFFSFAPLLPIPPTDVPEVSAGTHFVVSLRCHTPVTASVLFFPFFFFSCTATACWHSRPRVTLTNWVKLDRNLSESVESPFLVLSLSNDSGQSDHVRFFECFSSIFGCLRDGLPSSVCAYLSRTRLGIASTGCNNVHESLIPVLSRRVCGFYVYIVPSAAASSCRIFVKLPLNALVFLVFGFSFLVEERFCRLFFSSFRLLLTPSV